MKTILRKVETTTAEPAFLLIRVMVGAVFLSEGIQKFLFPASVGAGRFAKIGLPAPETLAAITGSFEIVCGLCVLLGLYVRAAVVPLLTIMAVASFTTKLPILQNQGFWSMAHEGRTDFAMILGSLFLLWRGAGAWSLDLVRKPGQPPAQ
ncbi:MAG TPA: DoxX family protein [Opitutaceae bacterium]